MIASTISRSCSYWWSLLWVERPPLIWIVQVEVESVSKSLQLCTDPSPNPISTLTCYQWTVFGLGEGKVCSFSDTDIDPTSVC